MKSLKEKHYVFDNEDCVSIFKKLENVYEVSSISTKAEIHDIPKIEHDIPKIEHDNMLVLKP
jgi:hypothetical protein